MVFVRICCVSISGSGILTFWNLVTARKWIPRMGADAVTNGTVIVHPALGIDAANPRAGIDALAIDTGLVVRALGVQSAFRTAVGWGAVELRQTGANRLIVGRSALGIGAAGRGIARGEGRYRSYWDRYPVVRQIWFGLRTTLMLTLLDNGYGCAVGQGIAGVAAEAPALGQMIEHIAVGVQATGAWTGIAALLLHTSPA